MLLFSACPAVCGPASAQNPLSSEPAYRCRGEVVSEEEYPAVSALTELNAPIVEALFGVAAPCSSLFTLAYDPSTLVAYTPSGDPVSVARIESIPGS